jgi:hypothetical protein
MPATESATEYLFSYGTLQMEDVQLASFGRRLEGEPDALVGYALALIPLQGEAHVTHAGAGCLRNARFTGDAADVLEGVRFAVTPAELAKADAYERSADYRRVRVTLKSGREAWMYTSVR